MSEGEMVFRWLPPPGTYPPTIGKSSRHAKDFWGFLFIRLVCIAIVERGRYEIHDMTRSLQIVKRALESLVRWDFY